MQMGSDGTDKGAVNKVGGASLMGPRNLVTVLRPVHRQDVEVSKHPLPLPTFTIASIRPRAHRGGESVLLKDAFPAGFCASKRSGPGVTLATEKPWPAGTPAGTSREGSHVLEGDKAFGIPLSGSTECRRVMAVTRLTFGSKTTADVPGSELVQFGPSFPCGPADDLSPRRTLLRSPRSPPPVSPKRTTIDGASLCRGCGPLVPWTPDADIRWPGRRRSGPPESEPYPKDSNARAMNRTVPGATPPWVMSCEGHNSFLSSPTADCTRLDTAAIDEAAADDNAGVQSCTANDRVEDSSLAASSAANAKAPEATWPLPPSACSEMAGYRRQIRDDSQQPIAGERDDAHEAPRETFASAITPISTEQVGCGEDGSSGGRRIGPGGAWDTCGEISTAPFEGSTCSFETYPTLDASKRGSSETSAKHTVKRSCSSLNTERYGGTLSKDATDIVRSHLESREGSPHVEAPPAISGPYSARQDLLAPAPPPSPIRQASARLLATLPVQRAPTLPKQVAFRRAAAAAVIAAPSSDCYVRTRYGVLLAVLFREQLLSCEDDVQLQRVKAAARPVPIHAAMTLAEGREAIISGGMSVWDNSRLVASEQFAHGGERKRRRRLSARNILLEYFDSRKSTWECLRTESDWRALLQARAGPHGAGVSFSRDHDFPREADFLVAVSGPTAEPDPPEPTSGSKRRWPLRISALEGSKTSMTANRGALSVTETLAWPRAPAVTPGTLRCGELRPEGLTSTDGDEVSAVCHPSRGVAQKGRAPLRPIVPEVDDLDGQEGLIKMGRHLTRLARRETKPGSGPGGALRTSAHRKQQRHSAKERPAKARVRRLVKNLEGRLKLKGAPDSGGVPDTSPAQKIDTPYTKELAKWCYDDILGIPRRAAPGRSS